MVDPRAVVKPRDELRGWQKSSQAYIPCLYGNPFNEGKEGSNKGTRLRGNWSLRYIVENIEGKFEERNKEKAEKSLDEK